MNVSDIKTRVKRQFGDESAVQITDADIYRWITDGQVEIVKQNESLLQVVSTSSSVAAQPGYALPSDLMILKTILYDSNRLKGLSLQQFEEYIDGWQNTNIYGVGTPVVYMVFASTITLFPTPDTSLTNGIKIYYCKKPLAVTADIDPISLPDTYHPAIVDYCLSQAYELDEDWAASGNKAQQLQQSINYLKDKEVQTEDIYYPTITLSVEDL